MKNIAIMGFKCCGKTSVAKALAERLGKQFVELDDIITGIHEKEKHERLSCREIHRKYGQGYFRALEAKAVEALPEKRGCIIALGGGTVAYSADVGLLKKCCTLVYLQDSAERLLQRIQRRGAPAFLDPTDLEASMRRELARREPLYERYADIKIDSSSLDIPEIVERILGQLK